MPRVGRFDKWVTLKKSTTTTNDADGYEEALDPSGVWCSIQPIAPGSDARSVTSLVGMRHHPQVNMDTIIRYQVNGTIRQLFVRGFQNLDENDAELRLLCEEVIP